MTKFLTSVFTMSRLYEISSYSDVLLFLVFMVKTHNKKVQDCVIKKLTEILTQNKKQIVQQF